MLKKMMLIGLLLVVFAGSLLATGNSCDINDKNEFYQSYLKKQDHLTPKKEKNIKSYWKNMKSIGYLTPEDKDFNLIFNEFIKLDKIKSGSGIRISSMKMPTILQKYNWKRYYFIYTGSLHPSPSFIMPSTVIISRDSVYQMPEDFNKLIYDSGMIINSKNVFEIIKKFIKLNVLEDTEIEKIEYKKERSWSDKALKRNSYTYNIEAVSYSPKYDIRIKWNFGFKDGKFTAVRYQLLSEYGNITRKFSIPYDALKGVDIFLNTYLINRDLIPKVNICNMNLDELQYEANHIKSDILQDKSYLTRKINNGATENSKRTFKVNFIDFPIGSVIEVSLCDFL